MNILLFGPHGQLGHELQKSLAGLGTLIAIGREELDLNHFTLDGLERLFLVHRPDWVVNAAAYTAVDAAEGEDAKEEAFKVNAQFPESLAKLCKLHSARLIHYSTDFVFDGTKKTPYIEEDVCHPLSVYGHSKSDGELAIQSHCSEYLIFRTSWLMGSHGGNFLKTMLRLASTKSELKVIDDQFGAPTLASWLAHVTRVAIEKVQSLESNQQIPSLTSEVWGIYHASGAGEISWHQYAKTVIKEALALGFSLNLTEQDVLPIPSQSYPLPAKRPSYSVLDSTKLKTTFGVEQIPWKHSVQEVLEILKSEI